MPDKEESGEVTFKIPNKILLYVALALGGGGAVWNKLDSGFLEEKTERTGRASYELMAKSIHRLSKRMTLCEERLDAIEEMSKVSGSGSGSSGFDSRGRRNHPDSETLGLRHRPEVGDARPLLADEISGKDPMALPSYDELMQQPTEAPNAN